MLALPGVWMRLCQVESPLPKKGVVGMLSWHGSHFWVCITFCRVRHGDSVTKPDYYYLLLLLCSVILEQFTVEAHPALFEGERWTKNEALLFQSIQLTYLHFQNAHKTLFQSIPSWQTFSKHAQNIQKLRRLALCAFSLNFWFNLFL